MSSYTLTIWGILLIMKVATLGLVALATVGLVNSVTVSSVQAKSGYHRSKTVSVKAKPFYTTSKHGVTYRANGSLTNFKFKKNHALKNYRDSTWVATSKTYIKIHGKNRLYYYVRNSDRKTQGWVWHGYLKPGKHNQMRRQDTKATGQYVMVKPGKLYQFGSVYGSKGFDPFNVRFNKGIKLSDQITYNRMQTWTIFKHGKKSTYYYVTASDKNIKGWVWHGFLKPRTVNQTVSKPVKPNSGTTNTQSIINGGSVSSVSQKPVQKPKPINPVQRPKPGIDKPSVEQPITPNPDMESGINEIYNYKNPIWVKDNGKRKRMLVEYDTFIAYIKNGGRYDYGIYQPLSKNNFENENHLYTNISYRFDMSNPYLFNKKYFGYENGKEKEINIDHSDPLILANGDIFFVHSSKLLSLSKPEKKVKYGNGTFTQYESSAPKWYQYNIDKANFTEWRFNLKTQEWDKYKENVLSTDSMWG